MKMFTSGWKSSYLLNSENVFLCYQRETREREGSCSLILVCEHFLLTIVFVTFDQGCAARRLFGLSPRDNLANNNNRISRSACFVGLRFGELITQEDFFVHLAKTCLFRKMIDYQMNEGFIAKFWKQMMNDTMGL